MTKHENKIKSIIDEIGATPKNTPKQFEKLFPPEMKSSEVFAQISSDFKKLENAGIAVLKTSLYRGIGTTAILMELSDI